MDKRDTTPIIVNGELRVNQKRNRTKKDDFKEPKKNPFADLLLTLICIGLIGYGVYTLVNKDDKKENKKSNSNSNVTSNVESNSNSNIKTIKYEDDLILTKLESTNLYSKADLAAMNTQEGLSVVNLSNNAAMALASKIADKKVADGKIYITEEELDNSIKQLFGTKEYIKRAFVCGKDLYTHNQETKMYYVLEESNNKITYSKYDYVEKNEQNDTLVIKNYVLYNDGVKSWTLNNTALTETVTKDNMKENLNLLKYYEYKFNKINDNYYLSNISIK